MFTDQGKVNVNRRRKNEAQHPHINVLEMKAVWLVLQHFQEPLKVWTNKTTVVYYINQKIPSDVDVDDQALKEGRCTSPASESCISNRLI